jgi:hypothetical protein
MRLTALGLAAATLIAAAQPALAQPAANADREDARCVLIMNLLAQSPEQKAPASTALFYFLGHMDGRGSGDKLEALLLAERKALEDETLFKAEFTRCGAVMGKRSQALGAMYERLDKSDKAAKDEAPAKTAPPATAAPKE